METAAHGWRSFVQVLRDFVTRAESLPDPPASPSDDPDDLPPVDGDDDNEDDDAEVQYREREIEAAQLRQAQGLPLHPHEQFILVAPEVYVRQRGPLLHINQTDVDLRTALYGCLAREMAATSLRILLQILIWTSNLYVSSRGAAVSTLLDS